MKNFVATLVLVLGVCSGLHAQLYKDSKRIILPDSVIYTHVDWVDFNNDTLLDVLVEARKGVNQSSSFLMYRNAGKGEFQFAKYFSTDIINPAYQLCDYDGDNLMDILLTGGASTEVFLSTGEFTFERKQLLQVGGSAIRTADLDSDGKPEVVLSGKKDANNFFHIYSSDDNALKLVHDSIQVAATSLEIFDFDNNGNADIFLSGEHNGAQVTQLYHNEKNLYFTSELLPPFKAAYTSVSDLNHDGHLDILASGANMGGQPKTLLYLNNGKSFVVKDSLSALADNRIFTGDLNSDGQCDISFLGTRGALTENALYLGSDTLSLSGQVLSQAFGDYDGDGDLDIAQLQLSDNQHELTILENTASANLAPLASKSAISAFVFNRYFLQWDKPTDDHTNKESLTYDVTLFTPGKILMPASFDLSEYRRLVVRHGNTGTNNYILLKMQTPPSEFFIQAVDNSYHANKKSICRGGGPKGCTDYSVNNLVACKSEQITLTAPENSLWVSFAKGVVHRGGNYSMTASASDTLFSIAPSTSGSCNVVTVYLLNVKESHAKTIDETRYVCEQSIIELQTGQTWANVQWSSTKKGSLSTEKTINFKVTEDDVITMKASNNTGCSVTKNLTLKISKPVIEVEEDAFQIMRGESVQLKASGAETYQWTPASGLDNQSIAAPTAASSVTTEYVVTGKDSIGCTDQAKVLVVVEETAFIPNLFTPNEDGKNDALKVYGLRNVSKFNFSIYNREGSLVYASENINEVMTQGWNGLSKGMKQPNGVYYWKVKGENNSGGKILLNGKTSGSIVLIR
jgi:gliding motility-associated-like protein